ncbi:uncharacterized protein VP01_489g3 [Puccinia sorghi]|uniref:UDENN domain-containing protein n=1 Tax=Puccinia sorghi TaxID=27349 RepID=A0A0L6UMW6_9BASI|nr:uncharacterized protein VP01_489g3 [Puccinia sorghi]
MYQTTTNSLTSNYSSSVDGHSPSHSSTSISMKDLVNFDNCYPPLQLSPSQMSNVAFSSFPDCAKSGSLIFSWRIPGSSSHQTHHFNTSTQPPHKQLSPASDLCGYVYFVQERDPNVLRGYNQRSLVLITHLPDYVGLFSTLIARLGPLYSSQGSKCLETALQDIISWPDPTPGENLKLSFLGQDHKFIIPFPNQAQIPDPKSTFPILKTTTLNPPITTPQDYHVLASNPTTYLSYIMFGSTPTPSSSHSSQSPPSTLSVSCLWLLWEILILAEPLVVFAATPDIVSDTVLHLKNLIRPIPFHANWRPYITIHDPDFALLFGKNKARAVGLIGATNPIILTSTHAWPNVLTLSQQGASFNHHIGLLTDHKRVLHKNKAVVKQILMCLERKDYHHADIIISRHFSVLTEQFLQPLQRYFTTLLPTAEGTGREPRRTGSFNSELFLKSLKEHTTALEFRSRLMAGFTATSVSVPGFYTAFLRSPNFAAWLHRQLVLGNRAVRDRFSSSSDAAPLPQFPPTSLDSPISHPNSFTNEPLHQVIKKIHHQLSKKNGSSSGLLPNSNAQPQPQQSQRKKEYSTMNMERSSSVGSEPRNGSGSNSAARGLGRQEGRRVDRGEGCTRGTQMMMMLRRSTSGRQGRRRGEGAREGEVVDEGIKEVVGMGLEARGLRKSRTISGDHRARVRRTSSTIAHAGTSCSSITTTTSSSSSSERIVGGKDSGSRERSALALPTDHLRPFGSRLSRPVAPDNHYQPAAIDNHFLIVPPPSKPSSSSPHPAPESAETPPLLVHPPPDSSSPSLLPFPPTHHNPRFLP